MAESDRLPLYEEIVLLALRDKEGTFSIGYVEQLIAGAIVAELLFDRRISIDDSQQHLVSIINSDDTNDPLIRECLTKMVQREKQESLHDWISVLSVTKNLADKVAQELCGREILRVEQDKVLLIFTRQIYPEINPLPEREIIERLKAAIFSEQEQVDPRTTVLISLANGNGLLAQTFGREEIESRKDRISQIIAGEFTGKAAAEVISGLQAAACVAAIMPMIAAPSFRS